MREIYVDGTGEDGVFAGDGQSPPFVVFDADAQENIAGPFDTRDEAEQHLTDILKGADPKLDAPALRAWCDKIDNNNVPCKNCGRTDLPLHTDYLCTECHPLPVS